MMIAAKSWLLHNHVTVPDDWLEACIEWVNEEHGAVSQNELHELIYEQWMVVDLHELQSKCLPVGIDNQSKVILTGYFALQIDCLLDVSESYYSQYVKFKGQENENVTVSGEQTFQPTWKPKPKRMLMLTLTDGSQNVQGMEYKPIPTLNSHTPPGTKVLIYGKIECRSGVLFLTDSNLKVLGGEAENLLEENNPLKIVARILGKENEVESSRLVNRINESDVQNSAKDSNVQTSALEALPNNSSRNNDNSIPSIRSSVNKPSSSSHQTKRNCSSNIGHTTANQTSWSSANSERSSFSNVSNTSVPNNHRSISLSSNQTTVSENEDFDFPDDDLFMEMEDEIQNIEEIILSQSSQDVASTKSKPENSVGNRNQNAIISNKPFLQTAIQSNFQKNISEDKTTFVAFKDPNEIESYKKPLKKGLANSLSGKTKLVGTDKLQKKQSTLLSWSQKEKTELANSTLPLNTADSKACSSSSFERNRAFSYPLPTKNLDFNSSSSSKLNSENSRQLQTKPSAVMWRKPYGYIDDLLSEHLPPLAQLVINGFISTLTSPLQTINDSWSLSAKINDGSGSLEVDIDNKVMEQLIGFKASEISSLKLKAQHNPEVKQIFKERMTNCKHSLINLCGLLTIQTKPSGLKPVVINLEPVTKDCIKELTNRVKMFQNI